jgi:hypothetical protein
MGKRKDPTAGLHVGNYMAPFDTTGMDAKDFPPGVIRETQLQRVNRVRKGQGKSPLMDPASKEARK